MFRLTEKEFGNLIFQFGTSSWGGNRKLPRAFTEHGVAMLSSVLRGSLVVFDAIRKLMEPPAKPTRRIGFGRDSTGTPR